MDVNPEGFLKRISGTALMASGIGISLKPVAAHAQPLKIKYAKETTTICPYCAVGCGIIVSARDGKVINTEGDPDHPINRGSLCSKGGSIYQLSVNKNRLDKPLYRAPYSDKWEEKVLGVDARQDRSQYQEEPGCEFYRHERQGSGGKPHQRYRLHRQCRHG